MCQQKLPDIEGSTAHEVFHLVQQTQGTYEGPYYWPYVTGLNRQREDSASTYLTSYVHHPFVFNQMVKAGYGYHNTDMEKQELAVLTGEKSEMFARAGENQPFGPEDLSLQLLDLSIFGPKDVDFAIASLKSRHMDRVVDLYEKLMPRLKAIPVHDQKKFKAGIEDCLKLIYGSLLPYYAPLPSP